MRPDVLSLARSQCGVLTAAQCTSAGLDRRQREALVRAGEVIQLRRGIFTPHDLWSATDDRGRHRIALAGALVIRGWVPHSPAGFTRVGGLRTAAFLHGLPLQPDAEVLALLSAHGIPRTTDSAQTRAIRAEVRSIQSGHGPRHIDLVSDDRGKRTYRHGVEVRPAALPAEHVVLDQGVPVTSLARTAVDLMRDGAMSDAVIAGDAVLRAGVQPDELSAVGRFCRGWPNGSQALTAIAFANPLAESPAESLARLVCSQYGLPVPELQVNLGDGCGFIGRVDLLFRTWRVVLEVDGAVKYTDPWGGSTQAAIDDERQREERLRRAGWRVVRTTWQELVNDPGRLVAQLLAAAAGTNVA